MKVKKCTYCKKEKELSCFYKRKEGRLGVVSRCSECMRFLDLDKNYEKPKDLENEIWKDVPCYEGRYQVSNLGRVKSLSRSVLQKNGVVKSVREIIIKTHIRDGYPTMSAICDLGKKRTIDVHRFVALTFLENSENKPCVNHKNGIRNDNRVENLEWCTYLENEEHARDVLHKKYARGEKGGSAKLTEKKVLAIRRLYRINPKYDRYKIGLKLGIHPFSLNDIHRRKSWKHI